MVAQACNLIIEGWRQEGQFIISYTVSLTKPGYKRYCLRKQQKILTSQVVAQGIRF